MGLAEATGLPLHSADFLTVAQALHWCDLPACRREFARVLRPGGWCVVAYNERHMTGDRFHHGYEALLQRYGIDYAEVRRQNIDESGLRSFFAPCLMRRRSFPNFQSLDRDALLGRILSSSYMPTTIHPNYPAMLAAIDDLFSDNQTNDQVRLEYDCVLSYGQLS